MRRHGRMRRGALAMRDFTLYLHDIDSTRFSASQSRYAQKSYGDEWRAAWLAYESHVNQASRVAEKQLREYALAGWRQDPRDPRCLRNKVAEVFAHFGINKTAEIKIRNEIINKSLVFKYENVRHFSWCGSGPCGPDMALSGALVAASSGSSVDLLLRCEEIRFGEDGLIEHEMRFLDGAVVILSADSCNLNLDWYSVVSSLSNDGRV